MQPTADDFRALARSSPWRWRTLHFTRVRSGRSVEAWLRRPGQLLVRPGDGPAQYVDGVPYSTATLTANDDGSTSVMPALVSGQPVMRSDGLVAERPALWHLEHGDPMFEDYTWTAMLDPEELSSHVSVDDVRTQERPGRETWVARLRPEKGYEPRCGCCPLLWSQISVSAEYDGDQERLARFAAVGYPDAYDVALDVRTGVAVSVEPVGRPGSARSLSLEIHEVDGDLDAVFAGC